MLHMEAHFRHWIKYKKGNCTQIIPNSVFFFSQFRVYIFAILTFFLGIAWYDLAVANLVSIGWYKLRIAKKNLRIERYKLANARKQFWLFFSELRVYISQLQVKSELWDINSQFWEHIILFFLSEFDFITRNCKFISHNSEKKIEEFRGKRVKILRYIIAFARKKVRISHFWLLAIGSYCNITQSWEKSQSCEFKSHNSD